MFVTALLKIKESSQVIDNNTTRKYTVCLAIKMTQPTKMASTVTWKSSKYFSA